MEETTYPAGAHHWTEEEAKAWRNNQLKLTDWIVNIADHSYRDTYLEYRTQLRNWPDTDSFPFFPPTKPTEL